jgi:hypothetical protein
MEFRKALRRGFALSRSFRVILNFLEPVGCVETEVGGSVKGGKFGVLSGAGNSNVRFVRARQSEHGYGRLAAIQSSVEISNGGLRKCLLRKAM